MSDRWKLTLALLFLPGLGCGPEGAEGPSGGPLHADVRVIHQWEHDALDYRYGPLVTDLAVDGPRTGLLLTTYGAFRQVRQMAVLSSEDDGVSWRLHELNGEDSAPFPDGVGFWQGQLVLIDHVGVTRIHSRPEDGERFTVLKEVPDFETLGTRDGGLTAISTRRMADSREVRWSWLTAETPSGRDRVVGGSYTVPRDTAMCEPSRWYVMPGVPDAFFGTCRDGDMLCQVAFEPARPAAGGPDLGDTRPMPQAVCLDSAPLASAAHWDVFATPDRVAPTFYTPDGVTMWLAGLGAGESPRTLPVGPGRPLESVVGPGRLGHSRFEALVPLVRELSPGFMRTNLYRWDTEAGAFVDSGLPDHPCESAPGCAARPAADGRYIESSRELQFERLDSHVVGAARRSPTRFRVFYMHERPVPGTTRRQVVLTMRDADVTSPPPPSSEPGIIPPPPEPPREGGDDPIDVACARIVGCWPWFNETPHSSGTLMYLTGCVDLLRGGDTVSSAALEAALSAETCAELADAIPGLRPASTVNSNCAPRSQAMCLPSGETGYCADTGDLLDWHGLDACVEAGGRCEMVPVGGPRDLRAACRKPSVCTPEMGLVCVEDGAAICRAGHYEACEPGSGCAPDAEAAARGERDLRCVSAISTCAGYEPGSSARQYVCHEGEMARCLDDGFGTMTTRCETYAGFACHPEWLPVCLARAEDCTSGTTVDTGDQPICDGAKLSFCYRDSWRTVDCGNLPGLTCGPNTEGILACVPRGE